MRVTALISRAKEFWNARSRNAKLVFVGVAAVCVVGVLVGINSHADDISGPECGRKDMMREVDKLLAQSNAAVNRGMRVSGVIKVMSREDIYARLVQRLDETEPKREQYAAQHPYGLLDPRNLTHVNPQTGRSDSGADVVERNRQDLEHQVQMYQQESPSTDQFREQRLKEAQKNLDSYNRMNPPQHRDPEADKAAAVNAAKTRLANQKIVLASQLRTEQEIDRMKGVTVECYATAVTNLGIKIIHFYVQNVGDDQVINLEEGTHQYYDDAAVNAELQ